MYGMWIHKTFIRNGTLGPLLSGVKDVARHRVRTLQGFFLFKRERTNEEKNREDERDVHVSHQTLQEEIYTGRDASINTG